MTEELRRLAEPYEILDLADGGKASFRPTSWERGTMVIRPRYAGAPAEKVIPVLRIHVWKEDKPFFPHYWDVTGKTAQAQLVPLLMAPGYRSTRITVTKFGVAPRARFSVESAPV